MTEPFNHATEHPPTVEATRMRTLRSFLLALPTVALAGLTVACADAPATAPAAPAAPSLSKTSGNTNSYTVSQSTVADTVVTVFVVGTNTLTSASFNVGNSSKIDFPYAVGSICDPATSSYGPGTWDAPCTAATKSIQITAKSWVNARGKVATDFQPALRFVPGLRKPVTLYLKDAALAGTRIDFCTDTGCVDESLSDSSLLTQLDPNNGFAFRTIKHFSGYSVAAD